LKFQAEGDAVLVAWAVELFDAVQHFLQLEVSAPTIRFLDVEVDLVVVIAEGEIVAQPDDGHAYSLMGMMVTTRLMR
jgi:hypothetical protein